MTEDFVLEAGDVLEISTHEGKKDVHLTRASTGVTENAFEYLADESSFWKLDPGDNIVRYGASDNHEGLEVTITAGITLAGV